MAAPAATGRASVAAAHTSGADRALAAGLTWLLVVTWASGVLTAVLFAAGVTATNQKAPLWAVVVAAAAMAVTSVPVLRWVRPAVEGVLFSHPDDAHDLIAAVGHRVQHAADDATRESALGGPVGAGGGTIGMDAVVAEIADQIARRLRLPYVAIVSGDDEPPPGTDGEPPPPHRLVSVPLSFAGEPVGQLLVLPRPRDRELTLQDLTLVQELATHVGIALHATRVSGDLQASRAAVITAREEERRRIRRDLHDGLGPTLASMRLHLAAVQQLILDQPERALDLVGRLREEVKDTSAQVRGLVYDLRPPMLDEFGLLGALRSRAAEMSGLSVTVVAPEPLPDLPAAVEVALYRIGSEALANVARHSGAQRCSVRLSLTEEQVRLQVDDDGRGLPVPLVLGVGLSGMRERAEELGGTFSVLPAELGTSLLACLPRGEHA